MAIENHFIQFMRPNSKKFITIQDHIKVGKLPLEIDMILEFKNNTDKDLISLGLYPFVQILKKSGKLNFITEYKSYRDRLKEEDLLKLEAYRYHYLYKNFDRNNINKFDTLLIITRREEFLKHYSMDKISNGVYQIKFERKINLIIIDELPIKEENYHFLIFSSSDIRTEFISKFLLSEFNENTYKLSEEFINYIGANYTEELFMAAESIGIELEPDLRKNAKILIDRLGSKIFVESIGKDEILEDLFEEFGEDEILSRLKKFKNKRKGNKNDD